MPSLCKRDQEHLKQAVYAAIRAGQGATKPEDRLPTAWAYLMGRMSGLCQDLFPPTLEEAVATTPEPTNLA